MIANKKGGSRREDFGNLRGIDRRGNVAVEDLQFSASGLVRDCRYLSLDNLSAVEANPDAGAYAVIHIVSIFLGSEQHSSWLNTIHSSMSA